MRIVVKVERIKLKMDTLDDLPKVIYFLGCVYAVKIIYSTLVELKNGLQGYFLPRVWNVVFGQNDFRSRYGDWALVTGSSQGIGRAYAHELAKRGINVVLVARNKERLDNVAKDIEGSYNVKTIVIVVDFTDNMAVSKVVKELDKQKLNIGVLVNNVGMMGPHFIPFLELDEKTARDMITVNCISATMMCHNILPKMLTNNKGAIINIVSSSSFYPSF